MNSPSSAPRQLLLALGILVSTTTVSACSRWFPPVGNERISADTTSVLIFGDSLSTGVFTSPDFVLDYEGIVGQATSGHRNNPTTLPPGDAPVRIRNPAEEVSIFGSAGPEAGEALLKVIEWPELSWSAQMARNLSKDTGDVVIAAHNGAEAAKASEEVSEWAADGTTEQKMQLPPQAFMFFTGDDLCRGMNDKTPVTAPLDFGTQLGNAARSMAQSATTNPNGTTLYLVSHLNIMQLAQSSTVLSQKNIQLVDNNGRRTLSCLEMLKGFETGQGDKFSAALISFSYNPMQECGNVLSHLSGLDPALATTPLDTLQQTQAAYQQQVHQLAQSLATDPVMVNAKVTVKLIDATESLTLAPEDMANDCFHLSEVGQGKLAAAIGSQL